jgi:hypothetical protein
VAGARKRWFWDVRLCRYRLVLQANKTNVAACNAPWVYTPAGIWLSTTLVDLSQGRWLRVKLAPEPSAVESDSLNAPFLIDGDVYETLKRESLELGPVEGHTNGRQRHVTPGEYAGELSMQRTSQCRKT